MTSAILKMLFFSLEVKGDIQQALEQESDLFIYSSFIRINIKSCMVQAIFSLTFCMIYNLPKFFLNNV